MSSELLNISAPRGVRPGAGGFCTIGATADLSPALEERLTLLSGYQWLAPPGEAGAEQNPINFAHWRLPVAGKTVSVLSRICDAGFDYSRRSNRFAHHVVLEPAEHADAGPAWVMLQPGVMRAMCISEPVIFPTGPKIPRADGEPSVCRVWAAITGDAGWAGVLAGAFAADPAAVSFVIYAPGTQMLPLLAEAISLLPPALRWQVTFSTYFSELAGGMTCAWRCCVAGTPAADDAARSPRAGGVLIDLTRPLPTLADSPWVSAARNGTALNLAAGALGPRTIAAANWRTPLGKPPQDSASSAGRRSANSSAKAISAPSPEMTTKDPKPNPAKSDEPTRRQRLPLKIWLLLIAWPLLIACAVVWLLHHLSLKPHGTIP